MNRFEVALRALATIMMASALSALSAPSLAAPLEAPVSENRISSNSAAGGFDVSSAEGIVQTVGSGVYTAGTNVVTRSATASLSVFTRPPAANVTTFSSAEAKLFYSFLITAPDLESANLFFDLQPRVFGVGTYEVSARGQSDASVVALGGRSEFTSGCGTLYETECSAGTFSIDLDYEWDNGLNFFGLVSLFARAEENTVVDIDGAGVFNDTYAYIDPQIFIDENFVAQNPGFEITQIVVPDVTSAVPEPATWASLLLVGGMAGAAIRRRREREVVRA